MQCLSVYVWTFLSALGPPPCMLSVGPSLHLSPPLCRLSLLWLRSRACGGWTSVSWLRIEPCCASSPASLRLRPCRRQRTSDPLTSFLPTPPDTSPTFHTPSVLLGPPRPHSSSAVYLSGRSCTLLILSRTAMNLPMHAFNLVSCTAAWPSEGKPADPPSRWVFLWSHPCCRGLHLH